MSFELNVNNANLTESDLKVIVPLTVNGKTATINLDTGAVLSCVGENTYRMFFKPGDNLAPTDQTLSDTRVNPLLPFYLLVRFHLFLLYHSVTLY